MDWKRLGRQLSELYQAASLMDAYDVDDYLASRNFKPKPPRRPWLSKRAQAKRWRKDQNIWTEFAAWADRQLDD